MNEITLPQGTIRYRDVGEGPVLLFVHGLLVNGSLWRRVVPALSKRFRCIVPDWPLGSHTIAMSPDADLSPHGIAKLVADFMTALDLRDVTIVGNDSGGAVTQIAAVRHGQRIARVVLTTCDAFEIFPPPLFSYLKYATYVPGMMALLGRAMLALPFLRRLPIAYGIVAKHRIDGAVLAEWIRPSARDAGVRRDVAKFIRGMSPRVTMEIAEKLAAVDKPFLLVWTPEDRSFPMSLAERLAATLKDSRTVLVDDAFVFVAEDQPEALVRAIAGFARANAPSLAAE